jgi:hypothetical protein
MMNDYVAAKGLRIQLTDILDAVNKRITDLPTIPDYVANGRPFVCWAHILGRCTFSNCQFKNGHVPRSAIADSFADHVTAMLTPGVNACVARGQEQSGSPAKRQRNDGPQAWHSAAPQGDKKNGAQYQGKQNGTAEENRQMGTSLSLKNGKQGGNSNINIT